MPEFDPYANRVQRIEARILLIRGERVMLDADLAPAMGYQRGSSTKR